jgi:hypothetical protein
VSGRGALVLLVASPVDSIILKRYCVLQLKLTRWNVYMQGLLARQIKSAFPAYKIMNREGAKDAKNSNQFLLRALRDFAVKSF